VNISSTEMCGDCSFDSKFEANITFNINISKCLTCSKSTLCSHLQRYL